MNIKTFFKNKNNKKILAMTFLPMAIFAILLTFYILHQKAVTLTAQPICGLEHIHTEECFDENVTITQICEKEEHMHTDECYHTVTVGDCGKEEHTHDDTCYEITFDTICEEIEHAHTDECFEVIETLICEFNEHEHNDDCYEFSEILSCIEEEHSHDDSCYENIETSICSLEEHTHNDACYVDGELVCALQEHTHNEACYKIEKTLICEKQEHEHNEFCYETKKDLICKELEHIHVDNCYEIEKNVICEFKEHKHSFGCYDEDYNVICNLKAHKHTKECFDEDGTTLICLLDEHTHIEPCFEKNVEFICEKEEHKHTEECNPVSDSVLICEIEEHTHTNDCFDYEIVEEKPLMLAPQRKMLLAAPPPSGPISFANWITNVSFQASWDGNYWYDVFDGSVQSGQRVRFNIDYTVPGFQLSNSNRTITYTIPSSITVINNESGLVYNKSGEAVGDYTINTAGVINITFNDKFVEKNQSGQSIIGDIRFSANVADLQTQKDGKVSIRFTNNIQIDLTVGDKIDKSGDLKVTKTQSQINNGYINYTITVSSEKGTNDVVSLKDTMQNLVYADSFNVVNKWNQGVWVQGPSQNASTFNLSLPKLNAGDTYTITYRAKIPQEFSSSTSLSNAVEVGSKDNNGFDIEDKTTVYANYNVNMLQKDGVLTNDGQIAWTVVLNQDKNDLGGYTLTDEFNGTQYTGQVQFTSQNSSFTASLPYTFGWNDRNTYTLTYKTPADAKFGSDSAVNKVKLTNGNKSYDSSRNVYIGGGSDFVTKTGVSVTPVDAHTQLLKWHLKINAVSQMPAPFTYSDTVSGDHIFTRAQLEDISNALNRMGIRHEMTYITTWYEYVKTFKDGFDYIGFEITFKDTLEKGRTVELDYYTTANVKDVNEKYTYSNEGSINNYRSKDSLNYSPLIKKIDPASNGDSTSHDYSDGKVTWQIEIFVPSYPFTIIEEMPKVLNFDSFVLNGTKLNNGVNNFNGSQVTVTKNDNYEISFDQNFVNKYKGQTVIMMVNSFIPEEAAWDKSGGLTKSLTLYNKASITDGNETKGSDDQTQTIYKTLGDDEDIIINKEYHEDDSGLNLLPFSIDVNEGAQNLVKDSDFLTATDEFNYNGSADSVMISLMPDTVKAYQVFEDGTTRELDSKEFSFTHSYTLSEYYFGQSQNMLYFKFPDSMHVRIEYIYRVFGPAGTKIDGIVNSVTLDDVDNTPYSEQRNISVSISNSAASATTSSLTLIKVDADNNSLRLSNVPFQLYKYNGTDYVLTKDDNNSTTFYTNSNGTIEFLNMSFNTAYKLVELAPLENYEKCDDVYFMIVSEDTVKYPMFKPANFKGSLLQDGVTLQIKNKRPHTDVSVKKIWQDINGVETANHPDYCEVSLYKYIFPDEIHNADIGADGSVSVDFTYGAASPWNIWETDNFIYQVGSKIRLRLHFSATWGGAYISPAVMFGNELIPNTSGDTNYSDGIDFTYDFTVSQTAPLTVLTNEYNQGYWTYSFELLSNGGTNFFEKEKYFCSTPIKTVILSEENNWSYVFDGLPLRGTAADGSNEFYEYTIKETPINNYESSISFQKNGDNYAFTLENKKVYTQAELPATGGIGVYWFYLIGLLLIGTAVYLIFKKRD